MRRAVPGTWLLHLLMAVVVVMALAVPARAIDVGEELPDPQQQARYEALTNEVRCLVCQNQTLADSTAPLAADLRRELRDLVEEGRSDAEIRQFLLERYGDFVLYRPRLTAGTALLWLAPVLLLAIGGLVLWRIIRRRASLPVPVDEEEPLQSPDERPPGSPA